MKPALILSTEPAPAVGRISSNSNRIARPLAPKETTMAEHQIDVTAGSEPEAIARFAAEARRATMTTPGLGAA